MVLGVALGLEFHSKHLGIGNELTSPTHDSQIDRVGSGSVLHEQFIKDLGDGSQAVLDWNGSSATSRLAGTVGHTGG